MCPKILLKSFQNCAKMSSRGPRDLPGAPRSSSEPHKTFTRLPKSAQELSKGALGDPKSGQRRPKTLPRASPRSPLGSQEGCRRDRKRIQEQNHDFAKIVLPCARERNLERSKSLGRHRKSNRNPTNSAQHAPRAAKEGSEDPNGQSGGPTDPPGGPESDVT